MRFFTKKLSKMKALQVIIIMSIIACIVALIFNIINKKSLRLFGGISNKMDLPVDVKAKNTSNYTDVVSKDGITVPVPTGYTASSIESEQYVNLDTDTGYAGFVIYEGTDPVPTDEWALLDAQKTRNQYVWIPVTSSELGNMYYYYRHVMYAKTYEFKNTGYTAQTTSLIDRGEPNFAYTIDKESDWMGGLYGSRTTQELISEMQSRFYKMLESIATYGGFYCGRYETGDLNKNSFVVRKLNANIGSLNWYMIYEHSKNLKNSNTAVETNIIWYIQYDMVLKHILDLGIKTNDDIATDSSGFGNYKTSTFTYLKTDGTTATKTIDTVTVIPTGSAEYTKVFNIYDLAGNVGEFTMAASRSLSNRYYRGGKASYDSNTYISKYEQQSAGGTDSNIGSRAVLYINY